MRRTRLITAHTALLDPSYPSGLDWAWRLGRARRLSSLWRLRSQMQKRGAGGWGGKRN